MTITSVAILLSFCFAAALAFNTGRFQDNHPVPHPHPRPLPPLKSTLQDHHPVPHAHPRPPPPKSMPEARQKLTEQAKLSTAAHEQIKTFDIDAEAIMQSVPKSKPELQACAEQTCETTECK